MRYRSPLALVGCVGLGAFAYGVAVGSLELFPYALASTGWNAVIDRFSGSGNIPGETRLTTSLVTFAVSVHDIEERGPDNSRGGGGLARAGDRIVGVDRWGGFFSFDGHGPARRLDVALDTGLEELRRIPVDSAALAADGLDVADLVARGLDLSDPSGFNLRSFRSLDLAILEDPSGVTLYVSHYVWHERERCKTLRVSRIPIPDLTAFLDGEVPVRANEWTVVYDSYPCLGFDYRNNSPFQSPNSGGRLAFMPDGTLLLTVGDHHMDGFNNPLLASQDSTTSYGKVWSIDIDTGAPSVFARGLRNAQGLAVDAAGRVWETEHGPKGGDELNILEAGGNFGWPLATFGAQYNSFEWPLNTAQGRHGQFTSPLFAWLPSIGVSNLMVVEGGPSEWEGDLLVGSLAATSLFRVRVFGQRVVVTERIPIGERIRDLEWLSEDGIVLWTDSNRLLVLRPLR